MTSDLYLVTTPGAGQLMILARPRGGDWLDDDVRRWQQAGVTTVASMLTAPENRDLNLENEGNSVRSAGMAFVSLPISDRGVPTIREPFEKTVLDLAKRIELGETVGLHCRMSVGRAPLVAAGVLHALGVAPEEAFRRISEARGVSVPETPEQKRWFSEYVAPPR